MGQHALALLTVDVAALHAYDLRTMDHQLECYFYQVQPCFQPTLTCGFESSTALTKNTEIKLSSKKGKHPHFGDHFAVTVLHLLFLT